VSCGDFTDDGAPDETADFIDWFAAQPAAHRLLICGNHEVGIARAAANDRDKLAAALRAGGKVTYLQDRTVEVAGLRVHGTPWMALPTTEMYAHTAWCLDGASAELQAKFRAIPEGLDLLVTHAPPRGVLDNGGLGGAALAAEVARAQPLVHCFGHVHSSYGHACRAVGASAADVLFINAAIDAVAPEPPVFFDL
jgi:Icc-related predicted phosphoesterase